MDNNKAQKSSETNETAYYKMDPAVQKRMKEKCKNNKKVSRKKWPFWTGVIISAMQPLFYYLSRNSLCHKKPEYECAYGVFMVLVVATSLFIFGILFACCSWHKYVKNNYPITAKSIIVLAAKCGLGAIFTLPLFLVIINFF